MPEPLYLHVDEMEVASWSPGAANEDIPCTQVHILTRIDKLHMTLVMRLKNRAACDELIAALIEHRDFVFGSVGDGAPKERH